MSEGEHASGGWMTKGSAVFALPTPCALVDGAGRVGFANAAWTTAQGSLPLLVIPGESFLDALAHLPSGRPAAEGLRQLLAGHRPDFTCELSTDTSTGAWAKVFAARDAGGLALVTVVPMTDRRARTDSDPESRFQRIIESAMDGILTVDERGIIVMFNGAAEKIFGLPATEAIGSPLERFIPLRKRDGHAKFIQHFGQTGVSSRTMGNLGTIHGIRADGSEFPIEASISQAKVGSERFYSAILRDVTEKKRLEAQLLQAQKMEGVGRLAGGIAHDFNNLVMAIFNYLALASRKLGPEHPVTPALSQANQAAQRAADLTRQLLTFARKQAVAPRVLSPRDVAEGLVPMLRRLIGEDVTLRTSLDPETGNVRADPAQLEQVLVNLAINARDAMPDGGTLTIETRNETLDAAYCRSRLEAVPGEHVVIAVSDTGTGMSPEVQSRIFEPFFTTKPAGKGTGLGLATCHGIVKQCGGHIGVYTEPGQGTAMRIYLPRVHSEATRQNAAPAPKPPPGGRETILLAEDSALVRELLAEELRTAGYTVITAENGAAALQIFESSARDIHLLLTDVVMPEMSGVQLAERVLARRKIPVIYMSGYTEETISHHGVNPEEVPFIAKPCMADTMLRLIHRVLNEHAGR
jgi:PAS domain S-box-containing protein